MSTLIEYDFQPGVSIAGPGARQAVVTMNLSYIDAIGQVNWYNAVPLKLVYEEGIWKLSYASLLAGLSNE